MGHLLLARYSARDRRAVTSTDEAHPHECPSLGVGAGGDRSRALDGQSVGRHIGPSLRPPLDVWPWAPIRAMAMRSVRCGCSGRCAAPHPGRRPQECPSGGVDASGIRDWRVDRTTLVSILPSRRLRSVSNLPDARAHIRTVAMRPVRCWCDGRDASALRRPAPSSLDTAAQRSLNTPNLRRRLATLAEPGLGERPIP